MLHFFLPLVKVKKVEGLPATCLNKLFKQAADSSKFPFFVVLNNKKSKDLKVNAGQTGDQTSLRSAEGGKNDISFTPTPANDPAGVSHCPSEAGHLIEKHVDLQNLLFFYLCLFITFSPMVNISQLMGRNGLIVVRFCLQIIPSNQF